MLVTAWLLVLTLVQAVVPISPQLWWDVDPRLNPEGMPVTSLGPTAMAWLHVAILILAGVAMVLHVRKGGLVRWGSVALAWVGVLFAGYHALTGEATNILLCGNWIASVIAALAVLHLCEWERPRKLVTGALAGIVVVMCAQAVWYVLVEHGQTVRMFYQDEARFLASRGWVKDSPQYLMYVRRLTQSDATGAFGLSNVLGCVAGALAMLSLGVGVWMIRKHTSRGVWLLLPGVAGLVVVLLSRSKGATVAVVLAGVVTALAMMALRDKRWTPSVRLSLAAGVVLALGAVLVRGALGPPPTADGERSLLFRGYYWQAAASMTADTGSGQGLLGRGPDGFHQAFPRYKPELCPEDVTSTHNMFIDWLTMLGVGGAGWGVLALCWYMTAWRHLGVHESSPPGKLDLAPGDIGYALLVAMGVFGFQFLVQRSQFLPETLLLGLLSTAIYLVVIAVWLTAGVVGVRGIRVGLVGAVVVLVVHSQIEMTFFHLGSNAVAWMLLACAASGTPSPVTRRRASDNLPAAMAVLGGVAFAVLIAVPVSEQQRLLANAAGYARTGAVPLAIDELKHAIEAQPRDASVYADIARLSMEGASERDVSRLTHKPAGPVEDALATIDGGLASLPDNPKLLTAKANLLEFHAHTTGQAATLGAADKVWQRLCALQPYDVQTRLRHGDLLWALGETDAALVQYRTALEVDKNHDLDPLVKLPEVDHHRIEQRIQQLLDAINPATPTAP